MELHNMTMLRKPNGEKKVEVPHDLVNDLLSRLPVNILNRLRTVVKAWGDLISDPDFVNLYREESKKKMSLLALSKFNKTTVLSRLNIQNYESSIVYAISGLGMEIKYTCPFSCDLICFSTNSDIIYVCNPSLRKYQRLHTLSIPSMSYSKLGFVYSSSTKEYKVVHLFLRRHSDGSITEGMECETFTFSAHRGFRSSSWTSIKQCPHRVYSNSASTDGRIYWLIRKYAPSYKLTSDDLIVSFDSKTENFKTIPRPSAWPLKNYRNSIELMAMEDNLCIVDVKSLVKRSVLDIWMLNENDSWEQFYSINLPNFSSLCREKILCPKYIFHGEIVFVHSIEEEASYCNCSGAKAYNIENRTFRSLVPRDHVGIYWESLYELHPWDHLQMFKKSSKTTNLQRS